MPDKTKDTQRVRLVRAFETLRNQGITPILKLKGSTGVTDWDLGEYKDVASSAGTPNSWVGAHVGAEECHGGAHHGEQAGGGYWGLADGRLRLRHDSALVDDLLFSYPLNRPHIPQALVWALEDQGFSVFWAGTDIDPVRLLLKEEV